MRNGISTKVAALSLVAGLLVAATALQAEAGAPIVGNECKVTTSDTLTVREGEQELSVKVSEELGEPLQAQFADDAKIKVNSVAREGDTVKIRVDASAAPAGDWTLTLRAGMTECKGDVKVAAAETDAR